MEVTPEHLLWIETKGWRRADEIEEGDLLRTLDGSTVQIDAINDVRGHFTVYNFEVENAHTYFVSESGLLVHNPKPPCPARFKRGSFRKKTLETEWKSAPPGNGPNSRTCPTCGKIIKKRVKRFYKGKNRYMKGYDSDHIGATWAERRKEMIRREKLLSLKYSRKEILDIYNDSTRAQCASCNRSHHFEPKAKETKKYLKKMIFPMH